MRTYSISSKSQVIQASKSITFGFLILIFTIVLFHPNKGWAESAFYISPLGSNSNSGTSVSPWKTFKFAIKKLLPGDTLILKDGTYGNPTTGLPDIDCRSSGGNAKNGTKTSPITIKAENERQAFLKSNGSAAPFRMQYCSYWNVEGLRGKSADLPSSSGGRQLSVFSVHSSRNINFKRVLSTNNNRYFNTHTFLIGYSSYVLVEESEAYYFHRHGFNVFKSSFVTLRRNYANSLEYADLNGGFKSIQKNKGDEGLVFYESTDSIMENNISEGNYYIGDYGKRNMLLGNISLSSNSGFALSKPTTSNFYSQDNTYINNVAFGNGQHGFSSRSQERAVIENCTSIGNGIDGIVADNGRDPQYYSGATWGNITPSLEIRNSLSLDNANSGFVVSNSQDFDYIIMDTLDAFSNDTNYGSGTAVKTNSTVIDPKMYNKSTGQGCIVHVPAGSPIKTSNIGANIVYRSENGIPTSTKLWNQTTGQFPCGAVVAGVNNNTSNNCIGVHERLNVGVNGCPIP